MKRKIIVVLILNILFMTIPVYASGMGGWNSYKGQEYSYEELNVLEEILLKDGYIELTKENNYLDLLDSDYKKYISLSKGVRYFIYKEDYDNYLTSIDKKTAMKIMWDNQVEFHTYGYIPIEQPARKTGTLSITLYVSEEYKEQDITIMFNDLTTGDGYSVIIHPYNDYKYTGACPIGEYTFTGMAWIGEDIYKTLNCSYDFDFFEVYQDTATALSIGIETNLPQNAGSITNDNRIEKPIFNSVTITEIPTPTVMIPEVYPIQEKKKINPLYIIIPILTILMIGLIIYLIIKHIQQNRENDF